MAIQINLTKDQVATAEKEAMRRQSYNEKMGYSGRNKAPKTGSKALEMHRLGCLGEVAVAWHLGLQDFLFADKFPVPGSADLPGKIEVKTRSKHGRDLLIQLDDDPSKVYILVTCEQYDICIVGWINGYDAMRRDWIREFIRGRPCYAVPQSKLHSMASLDTTVEVDVTRPIQVSDAWVEWDGDEAIIHFSPETIAMLGWAVGDTLQWVVDEQNQKCYLRKTNEHNTSNNSIDSTGKPGA